jgi:hypothetical protein
MRRIEAGPRAPKNFFEEQVMNYARITKTKIAADYPHRINEDGSGMWGCPVCCGDGRTTDVRYGWVVVREGRPFNVCRCEACDVWNA